MSATTTSPSLKAQQSAETREAILAACLRLFAKHGVSGTSIDEIAREAGITKGAVYWHFDSKDALFEAVLERIRVRWQEVVLRPLSNKATPVARVQALFDGYLELFTETPEICLFMQRVLLEADREFSPRIARIFTQTAKFAARILDEGKSRGEIRADLDSTVTAHMILAVISGASQQCLANRALTLKTLLTEAKELTLARIRR